MTVRLGDVATIIARQVDPRLPRYQSLPLINGENIESGTTRLLFRRTAADAGVISPKYEVTTGDVIYSKLRPYLRKVFVAREPGLCSADAYPLRLNSKLADPHWLAWMLVSDHFTKYATDASARARMPKLNQEQLFAYEFDLPPIEDQRRMAGRLVNQLLAVDGLRDQTSTRASSATVLRAALIEVPFARLLVRSERRSIASVARIQTGYAFRSEWFRESGMRLLRNANVVHRRIDWSDLARLDASMEAAFEAFRLREGDIVLSLDRPLVSTGLKVAKLTEADVPSLLLQRVARLIPSSSVDSDYLFAFLLTSQFEESVSGHDQSLAVPHLSPRQVGAIMLHYRAWMSSAGSRPRFASGWPPSMPWKRPSELSERRSMRSPAPCSAGHSEIWRPDLRTRADPWNQTCNDAIHVIPDAA